MGLPTVTVNDLTILLGTTMAASEVFSASDPDGDPIDQIWVRDNNANTDSSYWSFNGVIIPANVWFQVDATMLNLLVLNSGTTITSNQFQIRAEAGGQTGPISDVLVHTVVDNVTRPIVTGTDFSVVQSEFVTVSDFISANDPDGHPISRYKIFDANGGVTSGRVMLDGAVFAPNQWHYVEPEDWGRLRFVAGAAAPNFDGFWVRAFDKSEGAGSNGAGLWSTPFRANAFTTVNANRPIGIPTEYNIATDESVGVVNLFGWSDADGNTIKRVRFWDTVIHGWSGYLTENGTQLGANQWIERDVSALANMEWVAASRSFNEQVRFQVFDGNHWSDVSTFRVRTDEKPIITVAEDFSIRQQLEFVDISDLIIKLDDGPAFTRYEIYDANTDVGSGNFRLGATTLTPGVVHDISTQDFFDLEFKSGVYEQRSLDEIYVRAFNGTFWSDWTRHNVRTEPEYLDSLAAGSWLNFRPQEQGKVKLTFSFMQAWPSYGTAGEASEAEFISPWPEMRALVRQAFLRMEELVDIDFEEVPDSVNTQYGLGGDIRIGTSCWPDTPVVAYASFPGPSEINGDIWFNRWWTGTPPNTTAQDPPCGFPQGPDEPVPPGFGTPLDAWDKGDPNYATFIHELGHALGLKHPFDGLPVLPGATNSGYYTHMSYSGAAFPEWGQQLYDIAALQLIYGANTEHATGDTVYNNAYWRNNNFGVVDSVWDAGGIDTFDMSDQVVSGTIDLRPGEFSFMGAGGAAGGAVSIAFNTDIENAIGSQFGDVLIGNELVNSITGNGGDDFIQGYGGNDMLFGGGGRDTYIYRMFDGNDIINELKGAGRDTLEIREFNNLDNFTEDLSFSREGVNLIVDFTIDEGISRGSVTVQNQGFGKDRVETLDLLGVEVDLKYLYSQITEPGQQFALTNLPGQYGVLVAPV